MKSQCSDYKEGKASAFTFGEKVLDILNECEYFLLLENTSEGERCGTFLQQRRKVRGIIFHLLRQDTYSQEWGCCPQP